MEKRLYFCDICGDEIKCDESCHEITIEGATVVKRGFNDGCSIDDCKDWIKLLVCDKCYDREKDRSLIIPRYETIRTEWNEKMQEYNKVKSEEVPCNGQEL